MTVICMSQAELNRLTVVMDFAEGRLTARQAAQMLRLTERQAWRLLRRFRQDGVPGLVSRKRGRPSNRRHHPALRQTVVALVRTHYPDFGPTLACEKLAERHDLHVGRETLRKWMMAAGLWKEERTVTHNLTLQYDKVLFILEPNEITRPLARQRVTVFDYPDGRLAIRHKGLDLPFRTYDKLRRVTQAAIVENKRLSTALAYVAQIQQERDEKRSSKAPRRRGQGDGHMFKAH
ncbi:helix-turn-helix domain-containing protein [Microvirga sp. Mcv34]|uniref:helix-turn-helix domain-containing protein n=1 Tax=Microvirga sp. Mcv34 TaxID=2926016 RepID=UPI0021C85060|nr:helix-turn-helix domain-containing protein [Microvirga sp. Mcv34]